VSIDLHAAVLLRYCDTVRLFGYLVGTDSRWPFRRSMPGRVSYFHYRLHCRLLPCLCRDYDKARAEIFPVNSSVCDIHSMDSLLFCCMECQVKIRDIVHS